RAALAALIVTALPNVRYLTNFTGSSAIVVLGAERLQFLTDFRYVTAVDTTRGTSHECPDLDLVTVEGSYDAALAATPPTSGWQRVGFEGAHLTVARHDWLTATLGASQSVPTNPHSAARTPQLIATEHVVERARVRKDDYEIATMREAARRLAQVANQIAGFVRRGRTERDV